MLANLYFNYIYPGFYKAIWCYHNYIYPGFYKIIAPTEMKLVLCIVITAALSDLIRRVLLAPNRRRTISHTSKSTELLNGDVQEKSHVYNAGSPGYENRY